MKGFPGGASGKEHTCQCISQFSCSVMSDSLRPHWLQHTRPPCPSTVSGAYSISCPSSRWCHPTISSSVIPFSLCLQSILASESFPESVLPIMWPKYWSFSLSISPSNEYSGLISFRMNWFDLLAVQGTLKSLLQHQHIGNTGIWILIHKHYQQRSGLSTPAPTTGWLGGLGWPILTLRGSIFST